jgi:rhamnogalacturonyl hydrolase YesR
MALLLWGGSAAALAASAGCTKNKVAAAGAVDASASQPAAAADASVACTGTPPPRAFSDAVEPTAILRAMTAAADWQLANPGKWATNLWHYAAFWVGLGAFAPLSDDSRYLSAIEKNGESFGWRPAPRPGHADDQAIAASYFAAYSVERDRRMIEPALARFDEMTTRTYDEPLTWDESPTPIREREWAWCDALFMAPPAMAMASAATGDLKYVNLANKLWWKTTAFLYDGGEHLYYRDSRFFAQREPNGQKVFWSRGNGWVLGGTVRMLENMPAQYPERARYEGLLRDMAARVAALQGDDGFWRASLLDAGSLPRPESSGTAFFVYALAWGVNQGLLDRARFEPVIRKGWSALTGALLESGKLGWVQEVGFKPGDVCWDRTEVYGAGAFLLAGSEMYRMALTGDRAHASRLLRNPAAQPRFDVVADLPLREGEKQALAAGAKLVAIDGRSGAFLPAEASPAKGLSVVVSFYPAEERALDVVQVSPGAPVPAAPRGHAAVVLGQTVRAAPGKPIAVTLVESRGGR